jgi:hypothetical protein
MKTQGPLFDRMKAVLRRWARSRNRDPIDPAYPYRVDIPIPDDDELPRRMLELLAWGQAHAKGWNAACRSAKAEGSPAVFRFNFAKETDADAFKKRWGAH